MSGECRGESGIVADEPLPAGRKPVHKIENGLYPLRMRS